MRDVIAELPVKPPPKKPERTRDQALDVINAVEEKGTTVYLNKFNDEVGLHRESERAREIKEEAERMVTKAGIAYELFWYEPGALLSDQAVDFLRSGRSPAENIKCFGMVLLILRRPPRSTLFAYTALFRSKEQGRSRKKQSGL